MPIFVTIMAYFVFQEAPSILGLTGILVIFIGAHRLNTQSSHIKWYEPFTDLASQRASQLMLIAMLLAAATVIIDKQALNEASPVAWVFSLAFFQVLTAVPGTLKANVVQQTIRKHWKLVSATAILSLVSFFFQLYAIQFGGLVGLIIAIKRFDTLITIWLADILLKEKKAEQRIVGASIMAAGGLMIALS
jgi:drug/metabolite transporter (DMT)-like permease